MRFVLTSFGLSESLGPRALFALASDNDNCPFLRAAHMKTILVHMSYDDDRRRRLATAIMLATTHRAHLIGIFTKSPHLTPPAIVGRGASAAFLRELEAGLREQEQEARAEFQAASAKAGLSAEWLHYDGEIMHGLAFHSHCADLLVVSQTPPETVEDIVTGNRPDHSVLTAGCATLVVPHGNGPTDTGHRVLIAWKRTRQAARAVRDALPILRNALAVTVLTVGDSDQHRAEISSLTAYLGRHGINAVGRPDFGDDDAVGSVVLAHAADLSADLIVMGAYGHSRLREIVLGGTSEHVLSHASVPLMMSH